MFNGSEPWLPLKHVRVADFTQVIAGPTCSMLLADMGANIMKIEPLSGDYWRKNVIGAFLNFNRNKRGIALNLKTKQAHEAALRIIRNADVLIENFTPGTMDKLNLGYGAVTQVNPKIIYCSISGFGQNGPYRDRPGYDPVAQAMSGIMINTGEPDRPPVRVLPTMVDYLAGVHSAYAIMVALLDREKTNHGKQIDVSLLDVAIMQMAQYIAMYSLRGELPVRAGTGHPASAPYQAFETRDGLVLIGVITDEMWKNFCQALKLDDLDSDPRYTTLEGRRKNRVELTSEVAKITKEYGSRELESILVSARVPCGRLMNVDEVIQDPHVQFRQLVEEVEDPQEGKVKIIRTPIFFSGEAPKIRQRAPLIGEHTNEILKEVGYSQEEIEEMLGNGVALQSPAQSR